MCNYERIVNKEKKEASIRLFGEIGKDVDGNQVAHDLAELGEKMDTINLHLNSGGGSVFQGFSIVSAILSARAFVHVFVDGIAASMAAVIAISGDKVSMQDFAKLMIHDPFYTGKANAKLAPKDLKALDSIKDSLRTILSRRGCEKEKISNLMEQETWFNAEEAKTAGLVDEIVSTPRKEELSNLSTQELMNRVMSEYQPKKSFNMKEIAKALGLPENATEQQILDAIRTKDSTQSAQATALVDHYMTLGRKYGVVTDKNEEKMKRLAKADFELFAEMVSEAPGMVQDANDGDNDGEEVKVRTTTSAQTGRLSAALEGLRTFGSASAAQKRGKEGDASGKNYDWYQRNDPRALTRLEQENPKEFERLLNEYESKL